jgi:uncharacterized membrane protein YdjX (TVP38/TMEM64 family)
MAIALACAALAVAWRFTPLAELVTPERIIAWAKAVRGAPWAPIIVVLIYTPAAFVMFPRPLLTLLTVIAFGPALGFVYGMAGILLSALATYYAGRVLRPATVERLTGKYSTDAGKVLRRHGLAAMIAMRIVPAAPFVLEGILAGAMRIKLWHYTIGTFVGMLPGVAATSVFGDQITRALEDPSTINWWLVGAVLIAIALLTYAVKRWFVGR